MNIDNIPLALLGKKPKENLSGKGRGDCWGKNRKKLLPENDFFCIMKLIRSAAVQRRPRQSIKN